MTTYSSRERARDAVKAQLLKIQGGSPELVHTILEEDDFIDGYGGPGWEVDDVYESGYGLAREKIFSRENSERYYAIRYDDLKAGEEVLSIAVEIAKWAPVASVAVAAAMAVGGAAAVLAIVPATVSVAAAKGLITLGMRIKKKAADLSDDEFTIISALKHNGPQSVESLAFILNGMRLSPPYVWSEGRVDAVLERLKLKRLRDGTTRAFAEKDGDGLWGASAV
jgi:hypothetical protein